MFMNTSYILQVSTKMELALQNHLMEHTCLRTFSSEYIYGYTIYICLYILYIHIYVCDIYDLYIHIHTHIKWESRGVVECRQRFFRSQLLTRYVLQNGQEERQCATTFHQSLDGLQD